jgi:hypothetical protein
MCSICLGTARYALRPEERPCGHVFHAGCIRRWLYVNRYCPLCVCPKGWHYVQRKIKGRLITAIELNDGVRTLR